MPGFRSKVWIILQRSANVPKERSELNDGLNDGSIVEKKDRLDTGRKRGKSRKISSLLGGIEQ
jgi:hypothetical protein